MARVARLVVFMVALAVQTASASPYRANFVGASVGGHSWGFWRVVDVPLDPNHRPLGFYASDGKRPEYVTYWCIGLGPYATVQVSQGLALAGLGVALALVGIKAFRNAKRTAVSTRDEMPANDPR